MAIQWFPGHMTKARRQIEEKLKLIDVAIELLDARLPYSSRNPMIDDILGTKPRLVLLNKSDLADRAVTDEWLAYFARRELEALPVDSVTGHRVNDLLPACKRLLAERIERRASKGMLAGAIRALIVGIPNVGKSTLINKLAGRKVAATGDKPGVTKGQQWIKAMGGELELLDTPGVLWPKFEDQQVGMRLAITGAIKEEVIQVGDVGYTALQYLLDNYRDALRERYALDGLAEGSAKDDLKAADTADREVILSVMEEIGRKRGCVVSGGEIDYDKTALVILRDLRAGKLGRISLERP
jgi:ribosome biogenesis GTPase A